MATATIDERYRITIPFEAREGTEARAGEAPGRRPQWLTSTAYSLRARQAAIRGGPEASAGASI